MIHPVATTLANFDFPTLLCIKETHSSRLKESYVCLATSTYIITYPHWVETKYEGIFLFPAFEFSPYISSIKVA